MSLRLCPLCGHYCVEDDRCLNRSCCYIKPTMFRFSEVMEGRVSRLVKKDKNRIEVGEQIRLILVWWRENLEESWKQDPYVYLSEDLIVQAILSIPGLAITEELLEEDKESGDRSVPFEEKAVCDSCGRQGAYDCMGDYVCPVCLGNNKEDKQ